MALGGESKTEQREPTFQDICNELLALKSVRTGKYKNSPINILPIQYWLSQIVVKAVRAEQCTTEDLSEEELMDVAVYSLLAILKKRGATIK
jgi:hypothetical protein